MSAADRCPCATYRQDGQVVVADRHPGCPIHSSADDRDTLVALIHKVTGSRALGDEPFGEDYDIADAILGSEWLAGRDRRVAAQTEDTIFDEFPDNLTIAELRHAILLGRRLDTTEGTHHD